LIVCHNVCISAREFFHKVVSQKNAVSFGDFTNVKCTIDMVMSVVTALTHTLLGYWIFTCGIGSDPKTQVVVVNIKSFLYCLSH